MESVPLSLTVRLPDWIPGWLQSDRFGRTDTERMQAVLELARQNVIQGTGGPFAAAVFDGAGQLISVGINRVVPERNSILHAETVALMLAHGRIGHYSLDSLSCELVSSCDPCAMCLGATLWSGVRRLVCGADRQAAVDAGFEEGPVFPESFDYLRLRGVEVVRGVLLEEARTIFELYKQHGGPIYNGRPARLLLS